MPFISWVTSTYLFQTYYSGETWGLADNYDLCLDECRLGMDGVAAVVSAYISQINGEG